MKKETQKSINEKIETLLLRRDEHLRKYAKAMILARRHDMNVKKADKRIAKLQDELRKIKFWRGIKK